MEFILSKNTYFEKLKDIVESLSAELQEKLRDHQREMEQLAQIYSGWLSKTDQVILSLQGILQDIGKYHDIVNIASITGSAVSLLGGAACLAGVALAPVTGGITGLINLIIPPATASLSVALTTGGLVGVTAGALTSQGAKIIECVLKLQSLEEASKLITDHCEETLKFIAHIDTYQLEEAEILNFLHNSSLVQDIRNNKTLYMEMFNNKEMRRVLHRISEGSASLNDYILFINFVSSEDLKSLKKL